MIGLLTLSALIYVPPYRDAFIADDYKHLEFIAPFVSTPWLAYRILSPFWLGWYYRPLQNLLILGGRLAFGLHPFPFYLTLWALHAVAALLLYRYARALKTGAFGAWCAAFLFTINAVHQEVVGWISSLSIPVAAILSLTALLNYAAYQRRPDRRWRLLLVAVASTLALLAREESLVLPGLLGAQWLAERRRPRRAEVAAIAALLAIWAIYGWVQRLRPTWTANAAGITWHTFWQSLLDQGASAIWLRAAARYLAISLPPPTGLVATIALTLSLLVIALWLRRGSLAARFGWLWFVLYLAAIYVGVWVPLQAVADRYLYLPWIGLALACGASIDQLAARADRPRAWRSALILVGLLAFLGWQVPPIRRAQAAWLAQANLAATLRAQMIDLVPKPTADAHFFAARLPLEPDYVQAMAAVWYNQPFRWPGGDMRRLREQGWATPDYYVFDYRDGELHDLMPELREATRTWFVWSRPSTIQALDAAGNPLPTTFEWAANQIAGPPTAQRWAIMMRPPLGATRSWASLVYTVTIPVGSELRFGLWWDGDTAAQDEGTAFRVRVHEPARISTTIFETLLRPEIGWTSGQWQEARVSMAPYWGKVVRLSLEAAAVAAPSESAAAYWANPRLVMP